jgi:hypothetical protein
MYECSCLFNTSWCWRHLQEFSRLVHPRIGEVRWTRST